ncbi:MAG: nucleotide exchange factor GrpE [Candidatus Zixiibacteriota bacterium]
MSKEKHLKEDKKKDKDKKSQTEVVEKGEKKEPKPATETDLLKEQLAKSEEQAKELEDRLLRLAAEYDNYRKRTAREFEAICQSANENLISKLLDTMDNFERALDSAKTSNDYDSFRKGVELIYTHLKELLEKEGLKEIDAVCKPFDPNFHEAVTQCESEEHEEGIVADEMCKGYMLNEKLLRPSKVVVSKGKPEHEKEENKDTDE